MNFKEICGKCKYVQLENGKCPRCSPSSACYMANDVESLIFGSDLEDATEVFHSKCDSADSAIRKIRTAATLLNNALEDIRKVFPQANYYSANDGFCLLLGPSHSETERANHHFVVDTNHSQVYGLSGGDW